MSHVNLDKLFTHPIPEDWMVAHFPLILNELLLTRKVCLAARKLLDECPNIYMETDGQEQFLDEALQEWERLKDV